VPAEVVVESATNEVVSEAQSASDSSLTMDLNTVVEIFKGVLDGFVHESLPGIESFIKDAESVTSNLKTAVANFQKGDATSMIQGLGELAAALEALRAAMGDAGAAVHQVDDLAKVVTMFKDSSQIVCHVGEGLIVNGKNIKPTLKRP